VFKAIVHDAEEGGYWAEVPALSGCFTQGETREELLENLKDAIRSHLAVLNEREGSPDRIHEIVDVTL
jgi:predicted RNase H-like HicB family nuclease